MYSVFFYGNYVGLVSVANKLYPNCIGSPCLITGVSARLSMSHCPTWLQNTQPVVTERCSHSWHSCASFSCQYLVIPAHYHQRNEQVLISPIAISIFGACFSLLLTSIFCDSNSSRSFACLQRRSTGMDLCLFLCLASTRCVLFRASHVASIFLRYSPQMLEQVQLAHVFCTGPDVWKCCFFRVRLELFA